MRGCNSKKYHTIRNIGITKDLFYKYVKLVVLYENVPITHQSIMEHLLMNKYRDFGFSILNDQSGINTTICPHQIQQRFSRECNGNQICPHKLYRSRCSDCNGVSICEHEKCRHYCKICSPVFCITCI